jgi:hypothetical protein
MMAPATEGSSLGLRESWRGDLNPEPPVYKTGALPLSYASPSLCSMLYAARRVDDRNRPRKQNWRHRRDTSALTIGQRHAVVVGDGGEGRGAPRGPTAWVRFSSVSSTICAAALVCAGLRPPARRLWCTPAPRAIRGGSWRRGHRALFADLSRNKATSRASPFALLARARFRVWPRARDRPTRSLRRSVWRTSPCGPSS